jgi:hypothetical protein
MRYALFFIFLGIGCSKSSPSVSIAPSRSIETPKQLLIHADLKEAKQLAQQNQKPLLVFLVLGDWKKHC